MPFWMWLAVAAALLVVEMLTVDLLFASLALAAVAAAVAAGFGLGGISQGLVFGVFAALSLFLLRPIALRHLKKRPANFATNVEALVGAEAFTTSEVTERGGNVKLNGEIWTARSTSGVIEKDAKVFVWAIEGATAVIKPIGEKP
ncbi:MAG: NfeD family protein [Candidatus Nanopelagicales bacterium]|jgi:membrane protein implicated in regulation of membrane protease activity